MGLGIPFNTNQYAVLFHMIALVIGLKAGKFHHYITMRICMKIIFSGYEHN
ncbi:thymidylate synthase [Brevibacillus laterosporus]|uniref:thymidylate synthase n=1 Tax=Brevibacillus laterosporus TaxID=1465 RepID=UPI0022A6844A|nr:thymidylate synthase [Brevibacillus laterosporus]MCZ0827528.1 thymidylate synthase [Brevibacillus laterosporus]